VPINSGFFRNPISSAVVVTAAWWVVYSEFPDTGGAASQIARRSGIDTGIIMRIGVYLMYRTRIRRYRYRQHGGRSLRLRNFPQPLESTSSEMCDTGMGLEIHV